MFECYNKEGAIQRNFFNNEIQCMCKTCNLVTGNFIRRVDCA